MCSSSALPTSQILVNLRKLLMSSPVQQFSSGCGIRRSHGLAVNRDVQLYHRHTGTKSPGEVKCGVIRNVDSGLRECLGLSPASSLIIWVHHHPYNDDVCPLTMNKALCWVHWEECTRSQRVYEAVFHGCSQKVEHKDNIIAVILLQKCHEGTVLGNF